jgi:NitT/TauT family transport system substrate-binding protein
MAKRMHGAHAAVHLISLFIAAFTLLTILPSCTPEPPAPQYNLRIGYIATQSCLPYLVIKEKGLDKKYGFVLSGTDYPSGEGINSDIVAGKLDAGITGTISVLNAAETGLVPDKIIVAAASNFVDSDHPYMGMLASKSINGWQDLKGKQVATNAFYSHVTAAIKGRLQIEGVADYKLVIMSIPNMGLAVADETIDAAALVEPYLTQSLLRGDGKLLGWIAGGPPFEKMEVTMLIFNSGYYRSDTQAVKAFLRAYLDAMEWINREPGEARLMIGRKLKLSDEVTQKIQIMAFPPDGHNDPSILESMQQVMVDTGMLKEVIPSASLYDETLLNEILAERRYLQK